MILNDILKMDSVLSAYWFGDKHWVKYQQLHRYYRIINILEKINYLI